MPLYNLVADADGRLVRQAGKLHRVKMSVDRLAYYSNLILCTEMFSECVQWLVVYLQMFCTLAQPAMLKLRMTFMYHYPQFECMYRVFQDLTL